MTDPNDLAAFLDLGWNRLTRGVSDPRASARHPVFATVSPEGLPEARTVVLRVADRMAALVEVHTDARSAKIASLRAHPFAQLIVWDARVKLQIRLSTAVSIHVGEEVAHKWERIPDGSRLAYAADPAPGTPIGTAHDYRKLARSEGFAALVCRVNEMELMQLSDTHRRAVFKALDGWRGEWRVP